MTDTQSNPPEGSFAGQSSRYHEPFGDDAGTSFVEYGSGGSDELLTLGWKDLCVAAGDKELLHHVSGEITSGMVAVMGPSGSGKSTLLNTLLHRLTSGLSVTHGEISLNGHHADRDKVKRLTGYVMQDDILSPHLTVRETLEVTCELRFKHMEDEAKLNQRVEDVLDLMQLRHCANNVIGEGLSGGERKRLSIALELLACPRILALDEPTSALDSLDALQLVQTLKAMVRRLGITVICTIHQPQYKVFMTFDRLMLLSRGNIVYDGPTDGVRAFCARKGYQVPANVNPADAVMDVATDMDIDEERLRRRRAPQLDRYRDRGVGGFREVAPRLVQFRILAKRSFIMATRRRNEFLLAIFQTILNAVLIGTVYLNLSTQASKSQTRMAALFYCCTNQGTFGAISSLNVFASDRIVALRDRNAGAYHALPYYASRMLVEALCRSGLPLLFASIVYWLLGLEYEPGHFFFFAFVMWLDNMAACSLATAISVWARIPEISSLVLPLGLEIVRLFGAFFLAPIDASDGVHWLMRVSYLAYAYGAVAHNDLDGRVFECARPPCNPATGAAKLKSLGLDELSKSEYVGGLIAFIVVCQALTYLGIRIMKF